MDAKKTTGPEMPIKKETMHANPETVNSKQLAILKKHFPQCFDKQDGFIQEKLNEVLNTSNVELSTESYNLNWLGKSYARLLTNLPPNTLINANLAHNQLDQHKNSNNLLVKGDNLEVLKHMVNAYAEKVKMIYIDPPYNTGSDSFVYQDDRKFTKEQLSELAGIDVDEAERILAFTDKGSNSHSAWLTFMYPRLYVARELLKDDGVIFISIDDNEMSQLKIICDEVFGEGQFVGSFVWKRRAPSAMANNNVSLDQDYVLCYQKTLAEQFLGIRKDLSKYKNPDNDPRGPWVLGDLTIGMNASMRPNQAYDLVDPKTGNTYPFNPNRAWAFAPDSMDKLISEGKVYFPNDLSKKPMQKRFMKELKSTHNPISTLIMDKVGLNTEATKTFQNLFGANFFDYSKPLSLIKLLLSQVCISENDITLDFFSGSGTTAHAALERNVEDNQKTRFIMVQLAEQYSENSNAYKSGYKTIFDITKARIEKAAEKIKQDNPEYNGDLGFKIYETVTDFRANTDDEQPLSNATLFDDAVLTDEQYQTLLTTWTLYDGSMLTTPIETVTLVNYTGHYCDGRLYLIAPEFSTAALQSLLNKLDNDAGFTPQKVVFYGNNFDSAKQMELNEALKSYANKKSLELDIVARY